LKWDWGGEFETPRPELIGENMRKTRILFSGEASFLSTGFATYNREILKRLHATGKYELAEFGSYAHPGDEKSKDLPWKFYGNLPATEQEKKIYESSPIHQFGKYKIDSVLVDFQPDIVFDARDPWMSQHLVAARFRDNYKLILMPTVDSAPQKKEWIKEIFEKTDVLTTYSRYGAKVLRDAGLKVAEVTSPGVNLDVFKPLDKTTVRDKFQLTESLFVFGTVMRNQKRKLFPDLFEAYRTLRNRYAPRGLVKKAKQRSREEKKLTKGEQRALRIQHSVLYCHTSWPDLGWDIPEYLSRHQLQRHVIFTYKCDSCSAVYPDWFAACDGKGFRTCRICGEHKAHMPNTHSGVDEETLVKIFNLFDAYIQPSICEGWGLPIMEAKACGVPGMYQNYSAMEDHVENGGGIPIKVQRFYHESETSSIRSLPDVADMVEGMLKFATDDKFRKKKSKEARECVERMHSWDMTSKKFETILDEIEILDREKTWDRPPVIEELIEGSPSPEINDNDFVVWLYINILKRPPDQKGYQDWMGNLAKGTSRQEVEAFFREQIRSKNQFEQIRWHKSLNNRGMSIEIDPVNTNEDVMPGVSL
jgi:glycosyltransferase involved in cell wall biosynthesis